MKIDFDSSMNAVVRTAHWRRVVVSLSLLFSTVPAIGAAETVAFWAFDEPVGAYPSTALSDQGPNEYFLALGPGGSIVPGKFGRALSTMEQAALTFPRKGVEGGELFGLTQVPTPPGRTVLPLSWMNAHFTALLTAGENHLRKEKPGVNPTKTDLNLGAFDWTVEFWFQPGAIATSTDEGVVFEIGEGPRGENDHITALRLKADRSGFTLINQPAGVTLNIPSDPNALESVGTWTHLAFVYDASAQKLTHYVNGGTVGTPLSVAIKPLPVGEESAAGSDRRASLLARAGLHRRVHPARDIYQRS